MKRRTSSPETYRHGGRVRSWRKDIVGDIATQLNIERLEVFKRAYNEAGYHGAGIEYSPTWTAYHLHGQIPDYVRAYCERIKALSCMHSGCKSGKPVRFSRIVRAGPGIAGQYFCSAECFIATAAGYVPAPPRVIPPVKQAAQPATAPVKTQRRVRAKPEPAASVSEPVIEMPVPELEAVDPREKTVLLLAAPSIAGLLPPPRNDSVIALGTSFASVLNKEPEPETHAPENGIEPFSRTNEEEMQTMPDMTPDEALDFVREAHQSIGRRLQKAREEAGLSVDDVTDILMISNERYRLIEGGKLSDGQGLTAAKLGLLAVRLGLTVDYFFEGIPGIASSSGSPDEERQAIARDLEDLGRRVLKLP